MPSNTRCRHGLDCNKNKKKRQFENKKFSDHEAKNGFYRIHIVGMYGLDCQKKSKKKWDHEAKNGFHRTNIVSVDEVNRKEYGRKTI